jgi:transcriptional regulator with XRE-family HTH domain
LEIGDMMEERLQWKFERQRRDIKLYQIAKYLDCSYNLISMYERGHANMDEQKVIGYKQFIRDYEVS